MSPAAAPDRTGLALAALGAVFFAGKAIIVKLAYRHGVDPVTLIMLRMAVALDPRMSGQIPSTKGSL